MKHVLLMLSFISIIANAQEIKVKGTRQIFPDREGQYAVSGITPDGRALLVTGPNSSGLYLINIKNGETRTITDDQGAGYGPVFSADGRYLCFKSDDFTEKMRYSSLKKIDLGTGVTTILEQRSRNLSQFSTTGNTIVYSVAGNHLSKGLGDNLLKSTVSETYLIMNEMVPVLYRNGSAKELKPSGEGSYLWASLSPDRSKMVYYIVGKGTFVSDLDGNVIGVAGKINAPKWLNNEIIIGMNDIDDGHQVLSSDIVAFSLITGKTTTVTQTTKRSEMYPWPFADGKRIAFRTPGGELFIMKIKLK